MKANNKTPISQEKIFSAFFDRSAEGLIIINDKSKIQLSNPSAEQILNYNKGELNDKNLYDLIPVELHIQFHNLFDIYYNNKNHKNRIKTIATFYKKDCTKFFVEISISNYIDSKEGSLMFLQFSDITERYNTEYELKEERDLYENVLEKMGDAFISVDNHWKCTYINKNAIKLLKEYKLKKEYIGKIIWDVMPEIKGTVFETKYREVMEKRKPLIFENKSPRSEYWNEVRVCPHNEGIAIFIRNITENKQKEIELKKSEERFASAFHSSPVALSITRQSDGCFIEVNASFLNLFNTKLEDVIGKNPSELGIYKNIKATKRKKFIENLYKKINLGDFEVTLSKKNGTLIHLLCSAEKVEINHQHQIITSLIDLTEKKKYQQKILKMNGLLEKKVNDKTIELTKALAREKESNNLKSRFVSMASHEFRTPLAGLLLSTSILEKHTKSEKNELLQKHFNRIKSSVNNLTDILNDFLSLDKIEKGKTEITNVTFNLQEMAENIIDEMRERLKHKQQIKLEYKGISTISQDNKKIYNSLLNLISNASKYSHEDSIIDVKIETKNGKTIIAIKDTGIGIPEKDKKNIFTVFFRAHNAEYIQGTGLGLAIVKKYMEMIGGSINFTSQENKGSVFTLSFPVKPTPWLLF